MIRAKILKVDKFKSKKGNDVATVWLVAEGFELPFKIFVFRDVDKIPSPGSPVNIGIGVNQDMTGTVELKL